MHSWISVLAAVAILAISEPVNAQTSFPSGPVTMIIAGPELENIDSIHRKLAELVEPILGVKVEIENIPGRGGNDGVSALIAAKADGHVIAAVRNASITAAPNTGSVTYGIDDVAPIVQTTGGAPLVICAHPRFSADDGEDLVELAEDNPGKFTYATDGIGGIVQIAAERIFQPLKLDVRPVHFDGPAGAIQGFLAREVDLFIGDISAIIGQTKEGYAKCLLATSAEPTRSFRDVDALDELDLEDRVTELWRGLIAPKDTPLDRLQILADAFREAAAMNEFDIYVRRRYEHVKVGTLEAFAKLIESESRAFAKVAKNIDFTKN